MCLCRPPQTATMVPAKQFPATMMSRVSITSDFSAGSRLASARPLAGDSERTNTILTVLGEDELSHLFAFVETTAMARLCCRKFNELVLAKHKGDRRLASRTTFLATCGSNALSEWALEHFCGAQEHLDAVAEGGTKEQMEHVLRMLEKKGPLLIDEKTMMLAAERGQQDVVESLLKAWLPGAEEERFAKLQEHEMASKREALVDGAVHGGRMELLKWIESKIGVANMWGPRTFWCAADGLASEEMMEWMLRSGCPWDGGFCEAAARKGKANVVKWARGNGCELDFRTYRGAAAAGRVDILEWAWEEKCALFQEIEFPFGGEEVMFAENAMEEALAEGQVEAAKWLHRHGHALPAFAVELAALGGHVEALEWLMEEGCGGFNFAFGDCVRNGHVKAAKWLYEKKVYPPGSGGSVFDLGVKSENLELVQWMREMGFKGSEWSGNKAVENNDVPMLEWLKKCGLLRLNISRREVTRWYSKWALEFATVKWLYANEPKVLETVASVPKALRADALAWLAKELKKGKKEAVAV